MNTFGLDTWGNVFNESLQSLWLSFTQFAPKLIVAIVFFIIGWVLASLIAKAIEQVFASLKIDSLFSSIKVDNFLKKAGMSLNSGYFVGQVVRWFVIIIFLLPSLSLVFPVDPALGTNAIAYFLGHDVLGYLSQVIVAALVLIIAAVVSEGLSKAVIASSKSVNLKSANMLGAVAKYAVWIFAIIIALGKLGLSEFMLPLFWGIIAMLAIGGAIAFGLGGKDAASRLISKLGDEMSHRG
jgi:hypothetical protein